MVNGRGLIAGLLVVVGVKESYGQDVVTLFQEYFDQKVFGANPGPCTSTSRCIGDLENLPDNVKNINICLGQDGNNCGPLSTILTDGIFEIYDLVCSNVGIGPLDISHQVNQDAARLDAALYMEMGMRCSFTADMINVRFNEGSYVMRFTSTGAQLNFDNSRVTGNGQLTEVTANVYMNWAEGADTTTSIPEDFTIPANECIVNPNTGLEIQIADDEFDFLQLCANVFLFGNVCVDSTHLLWGFILGLFNWSNIMTGIAIGLESAFGGVICDILDQGAYQENGEPGFLNELWFELRDELLLASDGEPDDILQADSDEYLLLRPNEYITQEVLDKALNFSNSTTAELITVSINNYLGGPTAADPNNLVVNDLISRLTDPIGTFTLEGITIDQPEFLTFEDLGIAAVYVDVQNLTIGGLDTFDSFNILDFGFTETRGYNRTLSNKFVLRDVSFAIETRVELSRGEWVSASCNLPPGINENECESDSYNFPFITNVAFETMDVTAVLNTVMDMSQLDDLLVGQIVTVFDNENITQLQFWARNCFSPPFFSLFFPSIDVAVDQIVDPTFSGLEGSGMDQFASGFAEMLADATRGYFRENFGGFMQETVRSIVNDYLFTDIVDWGRKTGLNLCPEYVIDINDESIVSIDWEEGAISYVYEFLNNGIGGDPVINTQSDINELVDTILKYYEQVVPSIILDSWNNKTDPPVRLEQGYWELEDQYHDAMKFPRFVGENPDSGDFLGITNVSISNVNSIYKLTAQFFDDVDPGMQIDFGFGGQLGRIGTPVELEDPRPLRFKFTFEIQDTSFDGRPDQNEVWDFELIISNLDFTLVIEELEIRQLNLYSLTFPQAQHLPCLLQAVQRVLFPPAHRNSTIETLDFQITQISGVGIDDPTLSPIAKALWGVSGSIEDSQKELTTQRFIAFVNTVFNGYYRYYLSEIEDIPVYYEQDGIRATNCLAVENPLPSFENPFFVPDGDYFREVCLAPLVRPRQPVNQIEDQVTSYNGEPGLLYDFQTSFLIETINQITGTRETLENVMFGLADSTGNSLSEVFVNVTDPEGGFMVNLEFPLEWLGLKIDLTPVAGEDPDKNVIPGLIVDAGVVKIEGINKLTETFKLLDPVGPMTLRNSFEFSDDNPLTIVIESYIEIPSEKLGEDPDDPPIREDLTTTMTVTNLTIDFDLVMAINAETFGNLTLAHLFNVAQNQTIYLADTAFDCLLSTVFDGGIFLANLDIDVVNLVGPEFVSERNEILSEGIEQLVNATLDLLKDFYIDAVPRLSDNCLRLEFNEILRESWLEATEGGACPTIEEIEMPQFEGDDALYKFNKAEDSLFLQDFLQEYVYADDLAVLRTVIRSIVNPRNGEPNLFLASDNDDILFQDVPIIYNADSYGEFSFKLYDMAIENLDSIDSMTLFEPFFWLKSEDEKDLYPDEDDVRARRLVDVNTTLWPDINVLNIPYMTRTKFFIEGPMTITTDIQLNVTEFFETDTELLNHLRVKFIVSNLDFGLDLMTKINITKAMTIRFSSISEEDELPCLFVPVNELEPMDLNITLDSLQFELECLGQCDFFKTYGLELGGRLSNENAGEIAELINTFIEFLVNLVDSKGAQTFVDAYLLASESSCSYLFDNINDLLDVPSTIEEDVALYLAYGFGGAFAMIGVASIALIPVHHRRRKMVLSSAMSRHKMQDGSKELAGLLAMMELNMRSLFQHPVTPIVSKYVIPIVCITNVLALIYAILFANAANVVLQITALDQVSQRIVLVPFTVVSTINDLYNTGAWPLAFLIAIMSCAWPILKNLLLLVLWFTPSTIIRPRRRRSWLEVMDMLGKWSFLDVYVIVIMLAAMQTYVNASYYGYTYFLEDTFFAVDLNVKPETGIILLSFVAASSLIINHVVIAMHDRVTKSNNISEDKINNNHLEGKIPARAAVKRSVAGHVYIGKDKNGRVRYVSKGAVLSLVVLLGAAIGTFILACFLPLITFEHNGLIGLLLRTIEENPAREIDPDFRIKRYSLLELGTTLSDAPADDTLDSVTILFFQLLFFICVLLAPLLTMTLSALLLFRKNNLPTLKTSLYWTKIASYWSAVEVLVVSLAATIVQISLVTQFVVDFITNDACSYIRAALAELVDDPDTDAFCFDVEAKFEVTAYVLFVSCFLQLYAYYVITVIARSVVDDRYYASYHELRSDVRPKRLSRFEKMTLRMFTKTHLAPDDGIEGISAFVGLDNIDNDHMAVESDSCARLSDWCCNAKEGEIQADARIDAWQSKFGVKTNRPSSESDNPVFAAPDIESMPASPARERTESDNSILV